VLVNNERVGYLAARHLIDTGHRRLAFVMAHDDYQPVRDRLRGVRAAVAEAGAGVSCEEIDSGGLTTEHGYSVGARLARRDPADRPDGLIAVTDQLAGGIIHELHTVAGIGVPEQVAVVGCENNRTAGPTAVPLTAVDAPGRTMGAEAIRLLMDEVDAGPKHRHATVVLEPELVVRASAPR
jgi:LacI family transcriptional regulator